MVERNDACRSIIRNGSVTRRAVHINIGKCDIFHHAVGRSNVDEAGIRRRSARPARARATHGAMPRVGDCPVRSTVDGDPAVVDYDRARGRPGRRT